MVLRHRRRGSGEKRILRGEEEEEEGTAPAAAESGAAATVTTTTTTATTTTAANELGTAATERSSVLLTEIDEDDDGTMLEEDYDVSGATDSFFTSSKNLYKYRDHSGSESSPSSSFRAVPLRQRSAWLRLDVLPFAAAYAILICLDARASSFSLKDSVVSRRAADPFAGSPVLGASTSSSSIAVGAGLAACLVAHLALVLASQWSVAVASRVGYRRVRFRIRPGRRDGGEEEGRGDTPVADMTHVWMTVDDQSGIVPVVFERQEKDKDDDAGGVKLWAAATAEFQHRTYRLSQKWPDDDVGLWMADETPHQTSSSSRGAPGPSPPAACPTSRRLPARFRPVHYPARLAIEFYAGWRGHATLRSVRTARRVYGPNATRLTLPAFTDLLAEQLVAPFFLFQLLCVTLWSLDEYWMYALYTLLALLAFESTVAYNRLRGLQRLRGAGQAGTDRIWVRRGTDDVAPADDDGDGDPPTRTNSTTHWEWIPVLSKELVPGDVVSLSSGATIPADILIVDGSGVVDEALLTGESTPQLKHELESAPRSSPPRVRVDRPMPSLAAASSSMSMSPMISPVASSYSPPRTLDLHDAEHKESVLFGGTQLLAVTDSPTARHEREGSVGERASHDRFPPPPPDQGLVGIVLRTGFETSQGSLLRALTSTSGSSDGVHTFDAFAFVLGLVGCALAAAGWVWAEACADERRNSFRLILHLIILITSVVPPELPMELSLAVTNSVAALMQRHAVYCTEPFRIPLAGHVNVCCLDKTGTITSDEMRLRGVRLIATPTSTVPPAGQEKKHPPSTAFDSSTEDGELILPSREDDTQQESTVIPWSTLRIMVACHSLAVATVGVRQRNRKTRVSRVIGDPLEVAVLQHTGFELSGNNVLTPLMGRRLPTEAKSLTILHRFAFSSQLKRMTTIVLEEGGRQSALWGFCKGAPETIKQLLTPSSVPESYDAISLHHMSRGRRVLSMAYRQLGNVRDLNKFKDSGRDAVERDMEFAGFLILDCPLKPDSKAVISDLRKSQHRVVMITGDALLTAADVARQVGIVRKNVERNRTYQIQPKGSAHTSANLDVLERFECVPVLPASGEEKLELSNSILAYLLDMEQEGNASFCLSGDALASIALAAIRNGTQLSSVSSLDEKHQLLHPAALSVLASIAPLISVYARHTPHQKEAILAAYNRGGFITCMCGDGTNDVGALKRASVGISIVSAPEVESKQRRATEKIRRARLRKATNTAKLAESMRELHEAQDQLDYVELGDASVAAPFTSRNVSIKCCKDVIQQGRCTFVIMQSIYKILGVNCLVNAMVLSKLFLHGAKHGERQLTILGIGVAALFYFVTRAEPLPTLSTVRPPSSILCAEALLSILGQFVVHTVAILAATDTALSFADPYDPSFIPDGSFNPNSLNTCTFLLTALASVNTFAVNYRGRPFTADLRSNQLLYRTLQVCYGILFACAFEVFPPLNELLQLAPLPSAHAEILDYAFSKRSVSTVNSLLLQMVQTLEFPAFLTLLMLVDTIAVFGLERSVVASFEGRGKT